MRRCNPESIVDTAAVLGVALLAIFTTSSLAIDSSKNFRSCLTERAPSPAKRMSRTTTLEVGHSLRKLSLGMPVDDIELAVIADMRSERLNFNRALDSCISDLVNGRRSVSGLS
jgi:hypothetical protein